MKQLSKVEVRTGIRSVDGRHEYDTPGRKIGNRYDRMVRDFESQKKQALAAAAVRTMPQASTTPGFFTSKPIDYKAQMLANMAKPSKQVKADPTLAEQADIDTMRKATLL